MFSMEISITSISLIFSSLFRKLEAVPDIVTTYYCLHFQEIHNTLCKYLYRPILVIFVPWSYFGNFWSLGIAGKIYFSPRRGCLSVLKICMWSSVNKRIRLHSSPF